MTHHPTYNTGKVRIGLCHIPTNRDPGCITGPYRRPFDCQDRIVMTASAIAAIVLCVVLYTF